MIRCYCRFTGVRLVVPIYYRPPPAIGNPLSMRNRQEVKTESVVTKNTFTRPAFPFNSETVT